MYKIIKNNDSVAHTFCGQEILANDQYSIQNEETVKWANDSNLLIAIASGIAIVNNGTSDITDVNTAVNYLKDNIPVEAIVTEQPPFAQPTYRTKRNATSSIVTIAPNTHEHIDFQLTEDRYISGGSLIGDGVQLGDYVTGEIYDKDSVIPEAYRSALCENWPTVAIYVEKEWVEANCSGTTKHKIDTYPLNAKVTAGLYLRITYYATSVGTDRHVGFNYYLTKKL